MNTHVSLRTTLLLCLGVLFQNDRLNISFCGIYFGITTATILRTLDSGTNIFAEVYTSVSWRQSLDKQQSVTSTFATLAAALDPLSQRD